MNIRDFYSKAGGPLCCLLLMVSMVGCHRSVKEQSEFQENALGQTHPMTGKIFSVVDQVFITEAQLVDALSGADYILLGEKHDNPQHHHIQAKIVAALPRVGAVQLEMLTMNKLQQLRSADSEKLFKEASSWQSSGWPDYSIYQPLIKTIYARGLRPLPAHPPRMTVFSHMKASPPLPTQLTPVAIQRLEKDIERAHCGHLNRPMVKMMTSAQSFKDQFMAQEMSKQSGRGSVVLVAGNGHVRTDYGIPNYLSGSMSLAVLEVSSDKVDISAYETSPYEFVWFTQRVDNDDPCKKFEKQLRKMKHRHQKQEK
ncbi:MAG: ChaN family lipoprotein [Bradymonadia bacterium]